VTESTGIPHSRSGGAFAWYRVWAVIDKEWAEGRRNKMILWTMALVPLLLVAMILATDYFVYYAEARGQNTSSGEIPIPPQLSHLPPFEALVVQLNDQYMFYLFIIPMMLPVYIAAYSIIGEKQTRTLEPLLATPVSTWELLVAKSVAATAPAVLVTWLSFGALILGLWLIVSPVVFGYSVRLVWLLAMLLLSPLLAFFSVLTGVIVSSRINDPRTAQQITGIFILPIISLSLVVLLGRVFVSVPMMVYAILVTLVVDAAVLYFAVRVFQRETILTRWK
jgi:ABC-2 type transport system permease protein